MQYPLDFRTCRIRPFGATAATQAARQALTRLRQRAIRARPGPGWKHDLPSSSSVRCRKCNTAKRREQSLRRVLYLAVFAAQPVVTLKQSFRHSETSLDLVHVIKQRRRHADLSATHGHVDVRRAEHRTDIIGWFRAIERDNRRPVLWRSEQPMTCFTRPSFRCRASATVWFSIRATPTFSR